MPLDASAVRCAAYEIGSLITGGRIEKIYQPEKDEVIFNIKNQRNMYKLVISANSSNPRMYITNSAKENPQSPPMFCMLLRKHLSSGKIDGVKSVDFERIIDITIESRNEMGDVVFKHLMCEIMGKNSNIILTDENGKIIDAIKHVDISVSRVRNIFPSLTYHLPPDGERQNPLEMSEEDFYTVLSNAPGGLDIAKCMNTYVSGMSPLMAREAEFAATGTTGCRMGELSDADKRKTAKKLFEMFQRVKNYDFDCNLLYKNGEARPVDFAVYPINEYGDGYYTESTSDICECMELFYSKRDASERMRARSYSLMKTTTGHIDRLRKKITLLQETLEDSAQKEKYRIAGDIITANLYRMKMGDKSLTAQNYYDEKGGDITIVLDESKSPSKNAQQYYKKYQKAKTAESEAGKQLEKALSELLYLESVASEIELAKTPSELDEIKEEMLQAGIVKSAFAKKKQPKRVKAVSPDEYLVEDYTIYAGRNNVQNDYLTLKTGRSNDLWLHTKNIPGSHVLVKSKGEEIPKKVIEAAAIIAATNSKGKNSLKVEVDYCPVSHVKKPSGAKAGMVIYEIYETAVVTPSEKMCEEWKLNS